MSANRRRGALLFSFLICAACARDPGAAPLDRSARPGDPAITLAVSRGALEDRVLLTGELEAVRSETLVVPRSPTWSLAVRWLIGDGTWVKKGDRVVEFDSTSLTGVLEDKRSAVLRTESELESEVAKTAGTLADKSMEVERKRAALAKATVEAEVPADLRSRREFQEKQLALTQARDALAKAEEDLAAARRTGQLEQKVKEVARARAVRELADLNKQLEDLTLRAPRDGMVQLGVNGEEGRKYVVGDQVFPGWVVASLPELSAMQVRARLYDVDDGAAKVGMAAECILDAYPKKSWSGRVAKLGPVARPESRDASRRYFDVVLELTDPPAEIMRPGMSVRVEVIRRRAESALLLPRAALRSFGAAAVSEVRLLGGATQAVEIEWCGELLCVARSGVLEGTRLLPQRPVGKGAL